MSDTTIERRVTTNDIIAEARKACSARVIGSEQLCSALQQYDHQKRLEQKHQSSRVRTILARHDVNGVIGEAEEIQGKNMFGDPYHEIRATVTWDYAGETDVPCQRNFKSNDLDHARKQASLWAEFTAIRFAALQEAMEKFDEII